MIQLILFILLCCLVLHLSYRCRLIKLSQWHNYNDSEYFRNYPNHNKLLSILNVFIFRKLFTNIFNLRLNFFNWFGVLETIPFNAGNI